MHVIRWSGLVVFLAITVIVTVFMVFFADTLIERGIETTGTDMLEARVDLRATSLRVTPVGFEMKNMEVTNPSKPMTNAVAADEIKIALDPSEAMRMKWVVDEIRLLGLRFNTPRKTSGAIKPPPPPPSEDEQTLEMPSLSLPDPKAVLEKENLESVAKAKQLTEELQAFEQQWRTQLKSLPDNQRLEQYKTRLNEINLNPKGNTVEKIQAYVEAQKEIKRVRETIKADLKQIQQKRDEFQAKLQQMRTTFAEVKQAPKNDLNRLQKKYALDFEGLNNLSRALFGNELDAWIQQAKVFYQRIAPYLEPQPEVPPPPPSRFQGVDIAFKEQRPLPDFLIRKGQLSIEFPFGKLSGTLRDFSSDPVLLGRPGVLEVNADNLKSIKAIHFQARLLPVREITTEMKLDVNGIHITDLQLIGDDNFPLTVEKGRLNINVDGNMSLTSLLTRVRFDFTDTQLTVNTPKKNKWANALASAVQRINRFSINGDAKGDFSNYKLRISSDLDRVFNQALGQEFKTQLARFRSDLDQQLTARFNGKLKELKLNEHFGEVDSIEGAFRDRQQLASQLVGAYEDKLNQAVNAEKQEKRAELDRKKAEEQRKIDERKAEEKRKLDQKAEDEKQRLKDKLKDKLKF